MEREKIIHVHDEDDLVPVEETKIDSYDHCSLVFTLEVFSNGSIRSEVHISPVDYVFKVMQRMYGLENPLADTLYSGFSPPQTRSDKLRVYVFRSLWQCFSEQQKRWAVEHIKRYSRINSIEVEDVDEKPFARAP